MTLDDSDDSIFSSPLGNIVMRSAEPGMTPTLKEIVFKDGENRVLSVDPNGKIYIFDTGVTVDRGCYLQFYLWLYSVGLPVHKKCTFSTHGGELRFERPGGVPALRYDGVTSAWFAPPTNYDSDAGQGARQLQDMRDVAYYFRVWVEDSFEETFGFRWSDI